jgi:polyisoprenoid-binding protein YceI
VSSAGRWLLVVCLASAVGCARSVPRASTPAARAESSAPPTATELRRYRIDPLASSVTAVASATLGSYSFRFPEVAGSIDWVPSGIERSRFSLEVTMGSVTGELTIATEIIRSSEFLDVQRYPKARFASTGLLLEGLDRGQVQGVLELHGVSREVQVPGRFGFIGRRLQIDSEFSINRRDYGIANRGLLDTLVDDEVTVRLSLVAVPVERKIEPVSGCSALDCELPCDDGAAALHRGCSRLRADASSDPCRKAPEPRG